MSKHIEGIGRIVVMDNFMDKLAGRYSASEMIKANSQAETAQMEGLQEQVEAYEAVLQEMRKLNYKNTELTEKMYSLVDESIEKVRTLQIEASETGANPEAISREMSDAVTGALNEALNNMDSTVAKTISESLASALAQPTEDIKQSAIATMNARQAIETIDSKVSGIQTGISENAGEIRNIAEALRAVNEKLDLVSGGINTLKISGESDGQVSPELVDKIDTISLLVEDAGEKSEAAFSGINGKLEAVSASANQISAELDGLRQIIAASDTKSTIDSVNESIIGVKADLDLTGNSISEVKTDVASVSAKLDAVSESIASLGNTSSEAAPVSAALNDKLDNIQLLVMEAADKLDAPSSAVNTKIDEAVASTSGKLDNAVASVSGKLDDAVATVNGNIEEIKNAVASISVDGSVQAVAEKVEATTTTLADKIDNSTIAINDKLDAVNGNIAATKESTDLVFTSVEDVLSRSKALEEKIENLKSDIAETVRNTSKPAPVIEIPDNTEDIKAILDASRENAEKIAALAGIYERLDALSNAIASANQKISEVDEAQKRQAESEADSEMNLKLEATAVGLSALSEKTDNTLIACNETQEKIASLVAGTENIGQSVSEISGKLDAMQSVKATLEDVQSKTVAIKASVSPLSDMPGKLDDINASVSKLSEVSEMTNGIDAIVRGLWDSMENLKVSIADNASKSGESEELRTAVMDILTSTEEIRTGMRSVKSSQEESRTSLATALDTAIYGLKQDNREIVEFMQRMNTNLMTKISDPDKEAREEAQRVKEEENKQIFEERIKSAEEFMHKESVKVYRNVQAILNEKTDRQTDDIEERIKKSEKNITKMKVFVIIAAALSAGDLILQALRVFGII